MEKGNINGKVGQGSDQQRNRHALDFDRSTGRNEFARIGGDRSVLLETDRYIDGGGGREYNDRINNDSRRYVTRGSGACENLLAIFL